jgi:hypothetical protein
VHRGSHFQGTQTNGRTFVDASSTGYKFVCCRHTLLDHFERRRRISLSPLLDPLPVPADHQRKRITGQSDRGPQQPKPWNPSEPERISDFHRNVVPLLLQRGNFERVSLPALASREDRFEAFRTGSTLIIASLHSCKAFLGAEIESSLLLIHANLPKMLKFPGFFLVCKGRVEPHGIVPIIPTTIFRSTSCRGRSAQSS